MEEQEPKEDQQFTPEVREVSTVAEGDGAVERNTEEVKVVTEGVQSNEEREVGKNVELKPQKRVNAPMVALVVIITALVTSVAVCCAILLMQNNTTEQSDDVSVVPDVSVEPASLDDFGFEFIKLENENNKNIIYSPLSIKYALAMLSDAASGESKEQIDSLVGNFDIKNYANNDRQSLANAMFIREELGDQIHNSYTQTLEQKYNASVILDPFTSELPLNNWVSKKTFGMIDNLFDKSVLESDFVLVNALAIDMDWNNQLQCSYTESDDAVPCIWYNNHFIHENYRDYVKYVEGDDFDRITFNGQEALTAKIGASANNYDIVTELGEDYIRSTVQAAYDEWLVEAQADPNYPTDYDIEFDIDKYMEELNSNYGKTASSTDFYFADTDTEKVFAKDLQENEGSTLQYIGIMPKNEDLSVYIDGITADRVADIVGSLNDVSTIDGFKEGVITRISGNIPFFNFDYKLKLVEDLEALGITDVFIPEKANLSQMTSVPGSYIQNALHKADINFSNDGIRAAAATAIIGGLGSGGEIVFEYEWDVPVEEIDLTFDKPFFFIIRDKASGEVWFTGAVYNPAG